MAVGISKGMDALAKGLEKFFQNKREKAEEDAYAELLKKLNEMPTQKKLAGSQRRKWQAALLGYLTSWILLWNKVLKSPVLCL